MPWGFAALAVGTIGAAVISSNASSSAASSQQQSAQNSINAQQGMYGQTKASLAPYNQTGQAASGALAGYYGLPGGTGPAAGSPDFQNTLQNLPGYQFQLQQGSQATQRDLAARGLLDSGAAGKALTTFGQGLASNYGQQYASGLQGLAAQGENAAAQTGYLGAGAANQISSAYGYSGNASAAGYAGQGNALNQGLSGLAGAYGYSQGGSQSSYAASQQFDPSSPSYGLGG